MAGNIYLSNYLTAFRFQTAYDIQMTVKTLTTSIQTSNDRSDVTYKEDEVEQEQEVLGCCDASLPHGYASATENKVLRERLVLPVSILLNPLKLRERERERERERLALPVSNYLHVITTL